MLYLNRYKSIYMNTIFSSLYTMYKTENYFQNEPILHIPDNSKTFYQCTINSRCVTCYKINEYVYKPIENSTLIAIDGRIPERFHGTILYFRMIPLNIIVKK